MMLISVHSCYDVIKMEIAAGKVRAIGQSKTQRENILKKIKQNLRNLQDNNKSPNMHMSKVPEESKLETEKII